MASGGMSTYKPFSQDLHDVYDAPARQAVSTWMQMKKGYEVRENPNHYGCLLYTSPSPRD